MFGSETERTSWAGENCRPSMMFPQVNLQIPGFLEHLFAGGALVTWPLQCTQVLSPPVDGQVCEGASLENALIAGILVPVIFLPPFSLERFPTIGQMLFHCYLCPFDNTAPFTLVFFASKS